MTQSDASRDQSSPPRHPHQGARLGADRARLRDALPGGEGALRAAVWEFMRPMLSPAFLWLNGAAFVIDDGIATTVDLDGHRGASDLDELALDDEPDAETT